MANKIKTAITFSLFVSSIILPVYLGLGEGIGEFLFDNKTAGYYLSYSCFIMLPIGLNNIASSILNALGLEVKGFINYLIGSIFLIIAIIVLPQYTGILALVWGMGGCMIIAGFLNVLMIKKHLKIKIPVLGTVYKFLGISLPCAILGKNIFGILRDCMLFRLMDLIQ
jgi:O-antigen/teichoic acid export membrane protein